MARTPVVSDEQLKRVQPSGFLGVIDQGVRQLLTEVVRLLRVNNKHLEEISGNQITTEDLIDDEFSPL